MKLPKLNREDIKVESYKFNDEIISTRVCVFDYIIGGGLIPGSIIQILSESGLGKTTICLQIARYLVYDGKKVLFIDTEGSISSNTLEFVGLKDYYDETFIYIRESTFEMIEKIIDSSINNIHPDLIVIDSIASIINSGFIESKNNKEKLSIMSTNSFLNSRPLSLFFNKYNSIAKKEKITFLMTNQYRNTVSPKSGTIKKPSGGKNCVYNSDIILKIEPPRAKTKFKKYYDNNNSEDSISLEFSIIKSNTKSPNYIVPFKLIYGIGINNIDLYIYCALKADIIKLINSYYTYDGQKFHGYESLYDYLLNDRPDNMYDIISEQMDKENKS